MYILAIETTGKYGSAAIIDDAGNVYSSSSAGVMNHLQDIIALIEDSLKQAGISKNQLTHIAASVGPGSFTGIRIGVTVARTLGQVMNLPCIAVSALEAMALQGNMKSGGLQEGDYICPIMNARRHQTYSGLWQLKANSLQPVLPEKQYIIEDLLGAIPKDAITCFLGDGIDAYQDIIASAMKEENYQLLEENSRYQDAAYVARVALTKAQAGEVTDYNQLLPNYMRKSEAEMRLEAGTLSKKIHG